MIAVVFALDFEAAGFRKSESRLAETWVIGAMGEAFTATLAERLDRERPALLISAGLAGALHADLEVGDIVIGTNFSSPELLATLTPDPAWHAGRIETVPTVLTQATEKHALGQQTGSLAVDMETARVADLCRQRGIPMLSLRVISDRVTDNVPVPPEILADPVTGRPAITGLLIFLAAHPGRVPAFIQMVRHAGLAQKRLASALQVVLPQLVSRQACLSIELYLLFLFGG